MKVFSERFGRRLFKRSASGLAKARTESYLYSWMIVSSRPLRSPTKNTGGKLLQRAQR